jgi:hypothetical protein
MSLPYLSNWDAFASDADAGRWDNLGDAAVVFCLAELAYACDRGDIGDASLDQFTDALADDGYTADDAEAAREYLSGEYGSPKAQAEYLVSEADRVKRVNLQRAAKRGVVRFIQSLAPVLA